MNRGTFYNWIKVSEKRTVGRIRTAGGALGSLIDRVTPIEPRSCSLSCKFALEYGHSSTATDVAKIWWHFHVSLRRRETERNNNQPKEQGPTQDISPHVLLRNCGRQTGSI